LSLQKTKNQNNMKKLLITISVLLPLALFAQTSITSAAAVNEQGDVQVSWAIGEVITGEFASTDVSMSAGIQSATVTVETQVEPTELESLGVLHVYPNPASTIVTIESSKPQGVYQLVNMNGQVVNQGTLDSSTQVDVSALPIGTYILQIQGQETHSIIKQ
jgi:hypothetical protein